METVFCKFREERKPDKVKYEKKKSLPRDLAVEFL